MAGEGDGDDDEELEDEQLGNIGFLYLLMKPDPTDPEDAVSSPETPAGYKAKMDRFERKAEDLRIDLDAWDKEQAKLPPEQRRKPPAVYLGTVHSVKGAEWPNVVVQMPANKFPRAAKRRKPDAPPPTEKELQKESEALETDRRLAYVALTRAASNLTVVCPSVVGGMPGGISQFVTEAGLSPGENVPKPGDDSEAQEPVIEKEAHYIGEPEPPPLSWQEDGPWDPSDFEGGN